MGAKKSGASRSVARKRVPASAVEQQAGGLDPVLAVAADYYWEQDAAQRFTVWRATDADRKAPLAAQYLLGKTSAELCSAPARDPEHWVRHRALLDARAPFRDVAHSLPAGAGATAQVRLSGAPVYAPNGDFLGYRGIARESGAFTRIEQLLELEGALLRALGEADDLASVLPLVVRRTCDLAGFDSGCYLSVDTQTGALHRTLSSNATNTARPSAFADGQPLPEWLGTDPVWLADPADERARGEAWTSALVVPLVVGAKTIGALEFRTRAGASPEARLLQVLRGVAVQLGHLHARAVAAERLRESEQRFASTMALAAIGISHVDDDGRFLYVNPQLCAMLGYSESELCALTVREISHPEDVETTQELSSKLREGVIASFKAEKRYIRKDGSVVWAGLTVAQKRAPDGRKLYDVSIVEDISARKEAEQCIQYLANHDALTGLPNRARFSHLLGLACEAARRDRRRFAVLFVDLDRFKIINDTLGHEAGDATLRTAAARLRGTVRASDVVARLGGDEFVVLLQDVGDAAVAGKIAGNVLKALIEPMDIQGHDCTVSASIGICLHPDGEQEDQAVLRNADMAMYLAKQSGKNGYRLYVNDVHVLSAERTAIETAVRGALERSEYALCFDARLNAATNAVAALEARFRWTNAELAAVPAQKLAAAAEAGGLLVPINQRALRAACEAAAAWSRAGAAAVPVAVSLAAGQITDAAFVAHVREVLAGTELEPGLLELDATEDTLLYDPVRAARTLAALKSLGVTLAIDAFGTGKASFADLQRFPIDTLKLHAARTENIALDLDKQRYVEGVLALGQALRLRIVAAGVTMPADADFLRVNGCFALQGPIAPQSLSTEECEALLREGR